MSPVGVDIQIAGQLAACEDAYGRAGSVVAVRRWPNECYTIAGKLGGRYTCMEEMDCKDLLGAASTIEKAKGLARCQAVFEFADLCMNGIATPLRTIRQNLAAGRLPDPSRLTIHAEVAVAVREVAASVEVTPVSGLLKMIDGVAGRRVFRRELWREMGRALHVYRSGRGASLERPLGSCGIGSAGRGETSRSGRYRGPSSSRGSSSTTRSFLTQRNTTRRISTWRRRGLR